MSLEFPESRLISLAEERGFDLYVTRNTEVKGWLFINSLQIALHLDENGYFELRHTIPNTIIELRSERRSSFEKEAYFNEIYQQFESLVKACNFDLKLNEMKEEFKEKYCLSNQTVK